MFLRVANLRRKRERGSELVEFALFAMLMVPTLIWTFVNGFNLIRMNQCQQINRDVANQYIHGVDYSTYAAQQVAVRLAKGFQLNANSFTGNQADNSSSGGNVYFVLSEVMYVGAGSCGTQNPCNNQNKYVFLQQITFGEKTITFNGTQVSSKLGSVSGATRTTGGYVLNILTDSNAVCANCSSYFQTQLTDGQYAYVVEAFFADPALGIAAYPSGGIYTVTFL